MTKNIRNGLVPLEITPNRSDQADPWSLKPPTSVSGLMWLGIVASILLATSIGAWAGLAPLRSGIVAPGHVTVTGNRKLVQHLEGGILDEILVKDGEHIDQGDILFRLRDTSASASNTLLHAKLASLRALDARLAAEQLDSAEVVFPEELKSVLESHPELAASIEMQFDIFRSRREATRGQLSLIDQKIEQLNEEINGLESEIGGLETQLALIAEERADLQTLFDKGLAPKSRLLALKRTEADLEGTIGRNRALIARSRTEIAAAGEEKLQFTRNLQAQTAEERQKISDEMLDLRERISVSGERVDRLEVRAPTSGTVIGLRVHTSGAVIPSGGELLEIVPDNAPLIVEAKLRPSDIEDVSIGQPTRVRLSAYNFRQVPALPGRVTFVGADREIDPRTQEASYRVQVEIEEQVLQEYEDVVLTPGMPAEVIIETGESTVIDYMLQPILVAFDRAMRE